MTDRCRAALERISAIHLGPERPTDPNYLARLMQWIAREAMAGAGQMERMARMEAVVEAARHMPRTTPASGGASTHHIYQIQAARAWALDRALSALDALDEKAEPPR